MSSPICPDCSLLALNFEKKPTLCKICGWTGIINTRKIMHTDMYDRKIQETNRLLKLRKEKKLTYIRIKIKKNTKDSYIIIEKLIKLFNTEKINEEIENNLRFRIFRKVNEKELKELNSIKEIESIKIF